MKKTMLMISWAVILLLVALTGGCAARTVAPPEEEPAPEAKPPAEERETFTITFGHGAPATDLMHIYVYEPWAEYVEMVTEGRVKVDIYPNCALFEHKDALRSTETGLTDMGYVWMPLMSGTFPLMDLFSLPGLVQGSQLTSDAVMIELFRKYPCYREQYSDFNVTDVAHHVNLRSQLHTVEPIANLKQLKGKVIGCQDVAAVEAMNALGASGTLMVGADAYLGAQRGVLDGILTGWGWVRAFNLDEVCPYHTLIGISPGCSSYVFNKQTWDEFTRTEQWLLKEYQSTLQYHETRSNITNALESITGMPEENFIDWPLEDMAKIRELFEPAWDEWVEEVEALGYPGSDILKDTLYLIDVYLYN